MENALVQGITAILIGGAIVLLGQAMYAALGFGSGLISVSLWALLFGDIQLFVPVFLLLCLPTEIIISMKDFKKINMSKTAVFLFFIIPALVVGTWLLRFSSQPWMLLLLASVIITVAVYYFLFEEKQNVHLVYSKWFIALFGLVSGLMGGLFNMSGPPLVFYFKSIGFTKAEFRASLLGIFFIMSFVRLITYISFGLYTSTALNTVVILMPFALVGLAIGMALHNHLNEHLFKKIASLVLLATGLLIIIKNIGPFIGGLR